VRILVFGTSYCASPTRLRLLDQWAEALQRIAPTVDQLIIDSQSPVFDTSQHNFLRAFGERHICPSEPSLFAVRHRTIISFPENLGQLERGGRDGWGRAFSQGLLCGIAGGYDYVVHVEGDMLTRLDIPRVCRTMAERRIDVLGAVTPNLGWLEIGLMFLRVDFVRQSRLVERYSWSTRTARPYPEIVLGELLGDDLYLQIWRGSKDDTALLRYKIVDLHWLTKPKDPALHDVFLAGGAWPATSFGEPVLISQANPDAQPNPG
jgi:hypothetical protein